MADKGNGLHDPWAPPRHPPDEEAVSPPASESPAPEAEAAGPDLGAIEPFEPTRSYQTPAVPTPPYEPPPPARPIDSTRRRWPASAKVLVVILVVLLVGSAAGLGYAWWKTNEDKKDLESAANLQAGELSQQLQKANQDLAAAQQNLDAPTKQVADLQAQLKAAQDEAAAAKQQTDTVTKLFPINATTVLAGMPGNYRADPASPLAGSCTLGACPSVQLTLSVESSGGGLTASDPALGQVTLRGSGGGWTGAGTASASLQLQCAGAPQPTTFLLSLSPAAEALDSKGAVQVTTLAGSLVLTAPAVAPVAVPPNAGCPPGVSAYTFAANRT